MDTVFVMCFAIWYHLCNLKKRKKYPWKRVTFSKVAVKLQPGCYSSLFNCTNGTESRKASHLWISSHALQIPDSHYEKKNTQNEHIIAHFEYFFTCHYSKTVWLAENLIEIKITHYEKIFSHVKQKFSHFEKGLRNVLTKKHFFCIIEITIIFI